MFMGSSISISGIINFLLPDPRSFVSIPASADDAVVTSPSSTKTLLANGQSKFPLILIQFSIMGKEGFWEVLLPEPF